MSKVFKFSFLKTIYFIHASHELAQWVSCFQLPIVALTATISILSSRSSATTWYMSRDVWRPQRAGDNPASRTRGFFYNAQGQSPYSICDLMSIVDKSVVPAFVFLQFSGSSHVVARTSPAAAAHYQLSVSTATVSVEHFRLAFGDADTSEQQNHSPNINLGRVLRQIRYSEWWRSFWQPIWSTKLLSHTFPCKQIAETTRIQSEYNCEIR